MSYRRPLIPPDRDCKAFYTQASRVSREVICNDKRQAPQMPMWINRLGQQRRSQDQDHGKPQNPPVQEVRQEVHATKPETKYTTEYLSLGKN